MPGLLELRNNHRAFWAVQDLLLCPNKQTQKTAEESTEPWPSCMEDRSFSESSLEFASAHGIGLSAQAALQGPASARTLPQPGWDKLMW